MSGSQSGRAAARIAPLSIRMSAAERRMLEARAGGLPISTYARQVLFGAGAARSNPRRASASEAHIARVLGLLGQTQLAPHLTQIARGVDSGVLPLGPEADAALRRACDDIREIRRLLMLGLGLKAPGGPEDGLAPVFRQAAEVRQP